MTAGEKAGVINGDTGAIGKRDGPASEGKDRCIRPRLGHYSVSANITEVKDRRPTTLSQAYSAGRLFPSSSERGIRLDRRLPLGPAAARTSSLKPCGKIGGVAEITFSSKAPSSPPGLDPSPLLLSTLGVSDDNNRSRISIK